jgi:hypothetical protein
MESMQALIYCNLKRPHHYEKHTAQIGPLFIMFDNFSRLGRSYDQPRGGMWKGLQTFTQLENDHVGDDALMCQHY